MPQHIITDEFTDNEKMAIVEAVAVNFISYDVLSQKYNTMPHVIKHFVRSNGFKLPPKDLSEFPDFPRKSNDMSLEEYKKITRKYWNNRIRDKRQVEKKATVDLRVQQSLENLTPKELTSHPDFPKHMAGVNKMEYAALVDQYWINQRKRKMTEDQVYQISESGKKRKIGDFSQEELQTVFDQRVLLSISKETVAEKHETDVAIINEIISNHNLKKQKRNACLKQKMMKSEDEKEALAESMKMMGSFNCDLCQVKCPGQTALAAHLAGKPHKGKLDFDCSICQVQCPCQKTMASHLSGKQHKKKLEMSQRPDGGTKFRCEVCDIETSNQGGLDQHLIGKNHQKKAAKLEIKAEN